MLLADARAVLVIVDQQIGQLRPLLHQVLLGQEAGLPFELLGWNSHQLAQDHSGVVEAERLIEVARQKIIFDRCHWFLHCAPFLKPKIGINLETEAGEKSFNRLDAGRAEKVSGPLEELKRHSAAY